MNYEEQNFQSTYNRHIDMIYRLCFSFLKNKEDTEDAVQSVFIKYFKKRKNFENENHEKAWFIVTSSNICKDMLRQSWRRHNINIDTYDFISETENTVDHDLYMEIMNLPDKYKTVIYLYYYEGFTAREIARMIEKKESTVQTWLARGRKNLGEGLGGIE